jgi:ABC-2 type transport system permease protein
MWRRIGVMFKKELRQVWREPKMRALLFGPPVVQLIVFGYAVNLDVPNCRLGWMDRDDSVSSRELQASFAGSKYFSMAARPRTEAEVEQLLDRGDAVVAVRVPPGFEADLKRGRVVTIQALIDGADSNTASIVIGYVRRVVGGFSASVLVERLDRQGLKGEQLPGIRSEPRIWFNENLESRVYFVPGVVVNIIGLVTVLLTALAVVREKEIGTMEQLMVTPIRPFELMLGKTLPFGLIGLLEVGLVVAAALLVFDIPFRGNPLLLVGLSVLFLLATLGSGLLISTLSNTQQQAMMGSFFFFLPVFMLSGFAFPIRNMPEPVQYLTYLNVMRYFLEATRGIFLKGVGLEVLWPQALAMLVIGVGMIVLSAARFRKRLD